MGVEYYEQVVEKMGDSTKDFFRLFMVPGMFHCGGGVGTGAVRCGDAAGEVGWKRVQRRSGSRQPRGRGQGGTDTAAVRLSLGRPL